MTVETPAGNGQGEGASAPQITDERSAVGAIAGLLDLGEAAGDARGDNQSAAEAADLEDGESRSIEDEEGHTEAPAEKPAPIEPPKSWSDEDKAEFGKLPPQAQAVIARRESEREAQFTRRTQEIATERNGWEAERQAIAGQRQQYMQSLQQLVAVALPEAQAFQNVDWSRLSVENPAEYVRLTAQRDQLRGRIGTIAAEMQRVQGEAQAEQGRRLQSVLTEQQAKLVERVPEFADPGKAKQLSTELGTWLQGQGFNAAEIGQVTDHRLVSLAVRAMRADQADAARVTAEAKRTNTAPQVQRAGSPQGADDAAGRRTQAKAQQLRRTGSMRDAASLLMDLL